MANQKIEEYKQRLAEMYKAKSNDKLNTDENVDILLSPNATVETPKTNFGGTMAELGDNLLTGFLKGTEGMMDAVATVAGHVGSLFGADTKWAEDFVSADLANGMMNDWLGGIRNKSQESYTNLLPDTFQEAYDGITTSIGQMLPSIVLGAGGKILGAGSKAVQAISMGSFGASAMGTSVEEGLNEGATFGEATGYGVLQGAKEIGAEYLGGKLFDSKVLGVFGDTAEVGIKSLAKDAFGEGFEEVLSTAFDPVVRKITIDKDKSLGELYEGIGDEMKMSFITGAITGGIMGGASTGIQVAQYGVDGVNAMNTMQEAHETVEKIVKLEQKKTSMDSTAYQNEMDKLYKTLDKQYTKYESQIKELERKHSADSKKAQYFTSITEYMDDVATAHQQDLTIRKVIDRYNRTHKNTINYKALKQDKFTEAIKEAYGDEYKNGDEKASAVILTDNSIIVNKDSAEYKEGKLYNVIGHEFIHKIENTEGYNELINEYINSFTTEELNAKIEEYKQTYTSDVKRLLSQENMPEALQNEILNKSAEYLPENIKEHLLKEAFASYIGENVAVNYQEFAKMLGTNSKWSKIKEKFLGYRGSLTSELRNKQTKIQNVLTTETNTSVKTPKTALNSTQENKLTKNLEKLNGIELETTNGEKIILSVYKQSILKNINANNSGNTWRNTKYLADNSDLLLDAIINSRFVSYKEDRVDHFHKNVKGFYKFRGKFGDHFINVYIKSQTDGKFVLHNIMIENKKSSNSQLKATENKSPRGTDDSLSQNDSEVKVKAYRSKSNDSKPNISEDYDTSKGFKFDTENESFSIKGLSWYEKKLEKLEELEYKLDDGEISENSYYNRMDKINESVQDEIDNLDYALREFESYDLENLGDYETIPSKKQIEKLLNYANQIEDFINGYFPDVSVDFSEFYDEESYIMQMYKELSNGVKTEKETTQKGEIDYEDEFRRIQEESNRMSDEELQRYRNGSKKISDELYGRLSEVYRRRLDSFRSSNSDSSRVLKLNDFNIIENVDSKLFHDIFEINRCYLENGELVDLHDSYDDCICYISENGLSGFAIAPTGDLISVFNVGRQRGFLRAISSIVKEKATTLDCYVSSKQDLQSMYGRVFGFQTASIMDYNMEYDHDNIAQNHGMPQVAFMVNSKETIETKHFNKDQYEEAVDYQKQVLKEYPVSTSNSQVAVKESSKATTKNEVSTKEQLEQVEGEIVETEVATVDNNNQSNKKNSNQNKLSKNDSITAYKVWADLKEKKKWNKADVDRFFKALEADFQQFFGNPVKIDYKGNKETFAKQLFQELNTQSQTSIKESAENLVKNLTSITIDDMTFEEFLHLLGDNAYQDFLYEMNTQFEKLLSKGKTSQMEKVLQYYTNKINKLAEKLKLERNYNEELRKTLNSIKSLEKHLGKNPIFNDNAIPEVNGLVEAMLDTLTRSDYLKHDFRDRMEAVYNAFSTNQYLNDCEYVTQELLSEIKQVADNKKEYGNKKINIYEMATIRKVVKAIEHIYKNYDKAFINGKQVIASEMSANMKKEYRVKQQYKSKSPFGFFKKIFKLNIRTETATMLNVPFDKSVSKEVISELESASNLRLKVYNDITNGVMEVLNKKTLKRLQESHFKIGSEKIDDFTLIDIYMTHSRGEVATRHLYGNGVVLTDSKNRESKPIKLSEVQCEEIRKYVESNYTELIKVLKEAYKTGSQYYNDTMSLRTGYTQELEKNYYPMQSSKQDFTGSVDSTTKLMAQYQEYLSPSFTKKLEKNANNALRIKSFFERLNEFAYVMSNYRGISPTIQNLNRLFNTKVDGDITLMNYIKNNINFGYEETISKLLINMQDRRTSGQKWLDKPFGVLRGNVASASLAFNPKVVGLQMVSLPLAMAELGTTSKAIFSGKIDYKFMVENSPYFKNRFENNAVRDALVTASQNTFQKGTSLIKKVGDLGSIPIALMAKKLDGKVFNMTLSKVAKEHGMTFKQAKNNEAIKLEALKLAEETVRRTQSQNDVLEIGSDLYEASEIEKSFYMFTSDLRVIINNFVIKVHDALVDGSYKGKLVKFSAGFFMTQMLVALLDVVARGFLDKIDDEDEDGEYIDDTFEDFLTGTLENLSINMIPVFKDIYNSIFKGYDINNMSLESINDLTNSLSTIKEKAMTGEMTSKDWYNFSKAFGTVMGIPVKNLTEYTTALFTKFNAKWAIKTQDILYYSTTTETKTDIANAYSGNKISRLVAKTEVLLSDAGLDTPNTKACTEMARLYSKGFTQIYPSVDISTFSHEGQLYKLSEDQQAKFSDIYNDATKELELLISSPAYYKLNDTAKAKAIKKVYSLYYNLAKAEFIQDYEYSPTEEALFELDAHDLVLYLVHIDTIKTTTALSKKEQVIRYLNRQGLNKKELEAIFNILGYKVSSSNSILGNSMLSNSLFN